MTDRSYVHVDPATGVADPDDLGTGADGSGTHTLLDDGTWGTPPSGAPSGAAGGDLSGTYPNPSVVDNSHSHSHDTTITGVSADDHHAQLHHAAHEPSGGDAMAVDASAATGSLRTLGTGSTQAAAGNHTGPVAVASGGSHAAGHVPDPGASAGTTKFLREDMTYAVPAGTSAAPDVDEDGSTVVAAATIIDFRHGLDVTATGATAKIAVDESELSYGAITDIVNQAFGDSHAAGTVGKPADAGHKHGMPASGLTHSQIGTTSMGGSFDATPKAVYKKVTMASAGLLTSICVGIKGQSSTGISLTVAVMSDNSGTPLNVIAAGGSSPTRPNAGLLDEAMTLNSTARFIAVPVGAWLAAGDYWLVVIVDAVSGNDGQLAYASGTGSDRTQAGTNGVRDNSFSASSSGTNNYSIYADILT